MAEGRPRDPGSNSWFNNKQAKKAFRRELKRVQRDYDRTKIQEIVKSAEFDRNKFWKLVRISRQPKQANTIAIKNRKGVVVQELNDVVEAWRDHFCYVSSNKDNPKYDNDHYKMVTQKVKEWYDGVDRDAFLEIPFNQ